MTPRTGQEPPRTPSAISARGIVVGAALIPINTYLVVQLEIVRGQSWPSILSLLMGPLFLVFLLALARMLLQRSWPRLVPTPGEMLTIYVMIGTSTILAGNDQMQVLLCMLGHSSYYATASNRWEELFAGDLPGWLLINDPLTVERLYTGQSTLFSWQHMQVWLDPILWWTAFIVLLLWVMLCTNALVRKQWMDREKLTFPIAQVPLSVATESTLLRNKVMWLGFGIASLIAIVNEVNVVLPDFPGIPVKSLTLLQPAARPWSAIGQVPFWFFPFVVGIAVLVPADLTFSCWFFVWFQKLQGVLAQALGWDNIEPGFPFPLQQSGGALLGISLFTLWNERSYLSAVARKALGMSSELDDSQEPMSYRAALAGIVAGLLGIGYFSYKVGASPPVIVVFFGIYFLMALGVTRLRAELGPPAHDLYFIGPDYILTDVMGTFAFRRPDLNAISLFYWFNRCYGGHPMPLQLEAFRLAGHNRANLRRMILALMVAGSVGAVATFLTMGQIMYVEGAIPGRMQSWVFYYGEEPFGRLETWLDPGQMPRHWRTGAYGWGFLFTLVLLAIRLRWYGWPFHPLGFVLASSWYLNAAMWASVFLGWLIKVFIMRYGGRRAYQSSLPFFLGMILGDCTWGSIWLIVGVLFDVKTYSVWF